MGLPDDTQQRVRGFLQAAGAADAAALQFRQAAEAWQAGHPLLAAAEHRLALDLLRPLLPAAPVPAVPGPQRAGWLARGVQPLRRLGDPLKRLQFAVVMQGAMAWRAVVRLGPGRRPGSGCPPQVDPAHSQLEAPGVGAGVGVGDQPPTCSAAGLAASTALNPGRQG